MMKHCLRRYILIITVLFMTSFASANDRVLISSGNPDYAPSSWEEDGKIVGVAAELLQMILNESGIRMESKYLGPWKRVQHYGKTGEVDIITTIYRNKERETYLDYTSVPYMDDPNVVWVWQGRTFPFEKWDDLIGKTGTAVLGDSYGPEFDKFITEKLKMDRVHSILSNFKKLESGRSDYMPFSLHAGMIAARREGYGDKLVHLPTPLLSEGLYFAVSKKSEFGDLLPKIDAGIRKYKADGTIDRLIEKYIQEYVALSKKQSPVPVE